MSALPVSQKIAVIGAGAMGAGIAQVAASSGHSVYLYDIAKGAAEKAIDKTRKGLDKLVKRGKITQNQLDEICQRINPIDDLSQLADSALVIEAIVENIDIKRQLFSELEALCSAQTILASNTSSISISALAARLDHPGRFAGMHFFNPAPILKLVEIISGLQTDADTASCLYDTAAAWGKLPVHAKSTPGFIVNRVARPFYAEALRSIQENVASPVTIDHLMRDAGGFKMGPFELTDLIGQDVNYAVTESVFNAYYGDTRFQPSIVQREMLDAGLLGRKSGRGFYDYAEDAKNPEPDVLADFKPPSRVRHHGQFEWDQALLSLCADHQLQVDMDTEILEDYWLIDGVFLALTDGRTATQRAYEDGIENLVIFDLCYDFKKATSIAVSAANQAQPDAINIIAGFFQSLGKQVSPLKDVAGMQVMRTVCMLINEGADAVNQGICDAASVDRAMQSGVAYPKGPMAWANELGLNVVTAVLNNLFVFYGESRYRISPLLQQSLYAQESLL